jgi:acetyl-CoA carboxylase biotin carboxylase subunit
MPVTGEVAYLHQPAGPGIRVDSALYMGMPVTVNYDSLIAKVIAWAEDRPSAIRRLQRALEEFQISGFPTDIEFLKRVIESEIFLVGHADTTYLENFQPVEPESEDPTYQEVAIVAALLAHGEMIKLSSANDTSHASLWRLAAWQEQMRGNA